MSTNKIDIMIFSENGEISQQITESFASHDEIKIVASVRTVAELAVKCHNNPDVMVLICAIATPQETINYVLQYIDSNGIYALAVSDNTTQTFSLMKRGILSVLTYKPWSNKFELNIFIRHLETKIKDSNNIRRLLNQRRTNKTVPVKQSDRLIVIGSSTGGTEAIQEILSKLPEDVPPIVIVQHMPAVFTRLFAERLDKTCKMSVWEAKDGDRLRSGVAIVAPGEMQMRLKNDMTLKVTSEGKINNLAPCIDVFFNSVADICPKKVIGIILTGMGADGAKGLLKLRQRGAYTIGQNEKSCVVYGMPRVAYEIGAVQKQANISDIPNLIIQNI